MSKAVITTSGNMTFLEVFNSREVFTIKGFDTERKARNFAKKYSYEVFDKLPDGVEGYNVMN